MADRPLAHQHTVARAYIPTSAEIEATAAEIRASWSDDDRRKRLGLPEDDGVDVIAVRDKKLRPEH
jgi:hypothetical protein